MALEIRALTQLADVKGELGITASTFDARLERLIHVATDLIEDELGRILSYSAAVTEKAKGYGTPFITLERRPVIAIASVDELGTALAAADYELVTDPNTGRGESGLLARKASTTSLGSWPWTASRRPDVEQDKLPGTEDRAITVVYSGGYVTPAQAASGGWSGPARSLPHSLEQACIELVVSLYRGAGEDKNVTHEQVGPSGMSWGRGRDAMPEAVRAMIRPYARIAGA